MHSSYEMIEKSKYKSVSEWMKTDRTAYNIAKKRNLVSAVCTRFGWKLPKKFKPNWTLETCKQDAFKYKTRGEWSKSGASSYSTAREKGWLDECCKHMIILKRPRGYWSIEKCKEEAIKYKTRNEWQLAGNGSYTVARLNGWLDKCCFHMVERKPNGYWTVEKCKKEAVKYTSKSEWKEHSEGAYNHVISKGWMTKVAPHMVVHQPNGYWTLEKCKKEALKYKTKVEWKENSSQSYSASHRHDWYKECSAHMVELMTPKNYWTLPLCHKDALKYKTKGEWYKNNRTSYEAARKNGWYKECCTHMNDGRK